MKIVVEEAFTHLNCATRLWWSKHVIDEVMEYMKAKGKHERGFLEKLQLYAQAGFLRYEGDGRPIKHEGRQVYRISDGEKYRIGGYYEDGPRRKVFIALDAFLKGKEKLSSPERKRYAAIADMRDAGLVVKKGETDGNFPRLAKDVGGISGDAGKLRPPDEP